MLISIATGLAFLAGCASTSGPRERLLADGEVIIFDYADGAPQVSENSWASVVKAGMGANAAKKKIHWTFTLDAKVEDIVNVKISEVYYTDGVPVLNTGRIKAEKSRYNMRSRSVKISKEVTPWLYEKGSTEFIFKIVLKNGRGERRILYQPSIQTAETKQRLLDAIKDIETWVQEPRARLSFELDLDVWHARNAGHDDQASIIEYVKDGESAKNWKELVTWQLYKGKPSKGAAGRIMAYSREAMFKRCESTTWKVLASSKDDVLYEWQHDGCDGAPAQHELARIITGKIGVHRIAYTRRSEPMDSETRSRWLQKIKDAQLER